MPVPRSAVDDVRSLSFREPDEVLDADKLYTIYEVARLLQGLQPDAELDRATEDVLLDWAIPWVVTNADRLVIGEPLDDDGPGYYGLHSEGDSGENG